MTQLQLEIRYGLKALSWKEPYGSLMLCGKIETRSWDTQYRGLVLICCSKIPYKLDSIERISGYQLGRIASTISNYKKEHPEFKRRDGLAIAIGRLVDSRLMNIADEERTFTNFYNGCYCHVYTDVTPIVPLPWKGSQGWRTVPKSIIEQIRFLDI